jgi:formate dehydrogenase assembly factor FdhD
MKKIIPVIMILIVVGCNRSAGLKSEKEIKQMATDSAMNYLKGYQVGFAEADSIHNAGLIKAFQKAGD